MALLIAVLLVALAPATAIKAARSATAAEALSRGPNPNMTPLFNVQVTFDRTTLDRFKGISVVMDKETQQLDVVPGIETENGIAWARLADRMDATGWMELHVDTSEKDSFSNDVKMYSAGLVEGILTAERMSQFYTNFYPLLQPDEDSARAIGNIRNAFSLEVQYMERESNLRAGTMNGEPADPYWKHVRYTFLQLWGLKDGYNIVAKEKGVRTLDMIDMLFINSHAELPELMQAYAPAQVETRTAFQTQVPAGDKSKKALLQLSSSTKSTPHLVEQTREEKLAEADRDWKLRLAKKGHCSALVRVTDSFKDLLVGHTTWSDYSKMTRIYKYYKFILPGSQQSSKLIGFSSYPGCVSSTDDFYMLDNGLVVMDTSLEVLNNQLYDRVMEFPKNPKLPKFMNVMAVNRQAKTGAQWTALYAENNPGTGNSQFVIVDYNRFTPGEPIRENTVRILEMVPGLVHQADVSTELTSRGYWGGFNRPFFEDIRKMSGHTAAEASFGALYSFESAPRAIIMKKAGSSVATLADMRAAMVRNSAADGAGPSHAISARLDLDAGVGKLPNGGIDAKVVNNCLRKAMKCQAISGPTHAEMPVFRWKSEAGADLFPGWPHMGLPDVFNFDYVEMSPTEDQVATTKLDETQIC